MRKAVAACLLSSGLTAFASDIPSPSKFLGLPIGADKTLADYHQITAYFRALDAASERVEVVSLGKTTLGEEMIMAIISSEENLKNKSRIQEIAKRLADPLLPVDQGSVAVGGDPGDFLELRQRHE